MPIDVERLRRTFEDDAVLAELYAMYVQDTAQRIAELRQALDAGESERVGRASHALKGSSGNIGAGTMREVAAELEKARVEDGTDRATALLGTLEQEFARVEAFINEFIARAQATA